MIFLTGATGLVGSFICRELLKKGYQVRALKRSGSSLHLLDDVKEKVEWVEGDILDVKFLEEAVKGCDKVIHSAAVVSYSRKDEEKLYKVNVDGTANLVNVCLLNEVKHFLHISSVAAIGRPKKVGLLNETMQWESSDENTTYAKTKHLAELEVWRASVEGLPVTILNPSVVLGPGEWNRSSTKLFKYVYDEKQFYTEGLINWIDVRDVASIALAFISSDKIKGERYIVSAGAVSIKDLFDEIAQVLNKKSPTIKIKYGQIKAAYYLEQIKAIISKKDPLITKETTQLAQQRIVFDNSKVKNELSYSFISLKNTVSFTCNELLKVN